MDIQRPIVYMITAEDDSHYTFSTTDSRVSGGDAKIEHIVSSRLFDTMLITSTILNAEGYDVTFGVD